MAIKDWHADDRPREKLLNLGAAHLSDAEILAIFLRTGTASLSAIELARSLIEEFGSLAELLGAPQETVLACHGIGPAKYAQIIASLEMGTRYLGSQLKAKPNFAHAEVVKSYLSTQLRRERREVFALLSLDNALQMLNFEKLFIGGVSSCSVCIKEVLRHALSHSATQLIVAHNHPHTDAMPSAADTHLTERLAQAASLVDMTLVDHIIVGRNDVFSYAENRLLPVSMAIDTDSRHSVA
ncbi:RadC family protein [Psychrobacter aestuarii]|uniref:DNA repair protein RadC n=1 Tax=Psychrobacter aestuarii TaxID=556327 RepID=A0ABP3FG07_9GAMM|nr:DNA repair protein RadC [Psychrobacter aestuarii]